MRTRKVVVIGVVVALVAGGVYSWRSRSVRRALQSLAKGSTGSDSGSAPEFVPQYKAPDLPQDGTAFSIDQIRAGLKGYQSLFLDMKRIESLYKKTDRKRFNEEQRRLKEEERKLSAIFRRVLMESKEAREELVALVKTESDPDIKRSLTKLLGILPPEVKEPVVMELTKSDAPDDRKVGVEGLAGIKTDDALKTLMTHAETDQSSVVQVAAVEAIGRSANSAAGTKEEAPFRKAAQENLRKLTAAPVPEVRESAFRAISMQLDVTPQDQKLVASAIEKETDPKVKRTLEFTDKVMQARLKYKDSKVRGATTKAPIN